MLLQEQSHSAATASSRQEFCKRTFKDQSKTKMVDAGEHQPFFMFLFFSEDRVHLLYLTVICEKSVGLIFDIGKLRIYRSTQSFCLQRYYLLFIQTGDVFLQSRSVGTFSVAVVSPSAVVVSRELAGVTTEFAQYQRSVSELQIDLLK